MIKKILKKYTEKRTRKAFDKGYAYAAVRILKGAKAIDLDIEMYTVFENTVIGKAFDHGTACAIRDAIELGFIKDDRI